MVFSGITTGAMATSHTTAAITRTETTPMLLATAYTCTQLKLAPQTRPALTRCMPNLACRSHGQSRQWKMHCNTDADGAKKGTKTPAPQQPETLMSPKARHHDAELRGPLALRELV